MQKRGAEVEQHISASEQEYKKQYHRSRRILVVDDEPDITSSFKQPLRDNGFEVETNNVYNFIITMHLYFCSNCN
ncbi:MAG: hypothetical protein WBE34_15860 [Candidatus Nitrosopolaris sp.]